MKKKVTLLIISVFMLFLGLLLYLFLNREAYISKLLLAYIPIKPIISSNPLISILKSFGADFLWSTSFTMIIQLIIWVEKKKTFLLILCSLLGIAYELMQCFGIITGTADIVDGIVYVLGSILAIIIIQGGKLYEEKSNPSTGSGN